MTGDSENKCVDVFADYGRQKLILPAQYFMQQFIDGDLASNNGGWQWSASTGTDPQPYFRIFNPYTQAEKASIRVYLGKRPSF